MKENLFITSAAIIFLTIIGGCVSGIIITHPRPVNIEASELSALPDLGSLDAVAIKLDMLPEDTKVTLCNNVGQKSFGDLAELTGISKSILIDALSSRNIRINDSADKQLNISINKAFCEKESFGWKMSTVLKVRTGDGLIEEYIGNRQLGNMFQSSQALELAVKNSVVEMLRSPEINNYLKN